MAVEMVSNGFFGVFYSYIASDIFSMIMGTLVERRTDVMHRSYDNVLDISL